MARGDRWPPVQSAADQRWPPRWTTGAKDGVGAATAPRSRIWFTLAGGVLTEVYYPTVDEANTRELRPVLTRAGTPLADERDADDVELSPLEPGVPAYRVRHRWREHGHAIEKTVVADGGGGGYHLIWPRDLVEVAGGCSPRGTSCTTAR